MPAAVSPKLLAAYVAAAARQVLNGEPLTERSRWALAHARHQLSSDVAVLAGERLVPEGVMPAAVRYAGSAARPSLAAISLASLPPAESSMTRMEEEERVAQHLASVLRDVDTLLSEDGDGTEAAARLAPTFTPSRTAAA